MRVLPALGLDVDLEGSTIVVIAAAFDEESFEKLVPAAEMFLTGIEFDA